MSIEQPATRDRLRPVAVVVWERRERRRFATWHRDLADCEQVAADDYEEFVIAGRPLFFFMYEQLSPQQRQAEAERLNAALETNARDETARWGARLWDSHVKAWHHQRCREREHAESEAIREGEAALTRCTYLGGCSNYPPRPGSAMRSSALAAKAASRSPGALVGPSVRSPGERSPSSAPSPMTSPRPPPHGRDVARSPGAVRGTAALLPSAPSTGTHTSLSPSSPRPSSTPSSRTSTAASANPQPTPTVTPSQASIFELLRENHTMLQLTPRPPTSSTQAKDESQSRLVEGFRARLRS